ncbi:MAG TPA: DNA polymerase III subunit delta [Solirubrobacterales bacterium]|jgi:DNA polymerase-3 subunit delta|nr:DNA polymerase III subunit delta [Solirubrobacterales bacterium]
MAELKPAYLFTGDDEVKIDQARKRLAARAQDDGAQLEHLTSDSCTPDNFAAALTSPSLLPGLRIILADGVENWRAADVDPAVKALAALADGDLNAVAVLICRKKPLKAIQQGVEALGGEVREFKPPAAKDLPGWLTTQSKQLGVELEPAAARLIIDMNSAGSSRRLLSELEKLALYCAETKQITTADVEQAGCGETSSKIFALTDAAVAGDTQAAIRIASELVQSGEPPQRIVAMLARSFGQAQSVAELVDRGRTGEVATELKLAPWLANKLAAQARARGSESLRDALVEIARLDSASKGGSALDVETELFRSIKVVTTRG